RDVADIYLKDAVDFHIDPPSDESLYVPRKFLRLQFGGSDQQFIAEFKDAHPKRWAVFPQFDLNPLLPCSPGAAGLIFASRLEITVDYDLPWALFRKDRPSGGAVWRYMGDYRNRRCGSLTAEQFASQSQTVKKEWGNLLIKAKKCTVYVEMRARIALRKAGIDFDEDRVAEEVKSIRKKTRTLPVTDEDVIDALSRGDEAIDIIKMECISYDHEFVAEMGRRYDPRNTPAAQKRPKAEKASQPKTETKGKQVQKARPRRG
ncbi:hypothetical protein DFH06DRAFT_1430546, partial [Mycena polygramma]